MNFFDAVKTCLMKYATFQGRAARAEFWYWTLFSWLLSLAAMAVDQAGGADGTGGAQLASTLVMLATWLPGLAVAVRRLHDVNRSGWWFLVAFTGIGLLLLLYWFVQPGKDEGNAYQSERATPKGESSC